VCYYRWILVPPFVRCPLYHSPISPSRIQRKDKTSFLENLQQQHDLFILFPWDSTLLSSFANAMYLTCVSLSKLDEHLLRSANASNTTSLLYQQMSICHILYHYRFHHASLLCNSLTIFSNFWHIR
jgi:hypothetical protein